MNEDNEGGREEKDKVNHVLIFQDGMLLVSMVVMITKEIQI